MTGCMAGFRKEIAKCISDALLLAPIFPDELVHRVFFAMQAYLTNGWRLSFTHAAGIMNFWEGTGLVLPVLFQFLADTLLGNFIVAVFSAIFATAGIGMVALSVPRILEQYGGMCRLHEAESCLNDTQKALFFTGLVLTAFGRAGISFSLRASHDQHAPPPDEASHDQHAPDEASHIQTSNESSRSCQQKALQNFMDFVIRGDKMFIYLVGSLFIFIWIRKWKILFGIPAIYSACGLFWFIVGCCLYDRRRSQPEGSPITTVCRVLLKRKNSETKKDEETARFVVKIIPISITFVFCGVVSSIGNTYFVEQANHMDRRLGKWNAPILALQLPAIIFKKSYEFFLYLIFKFGSDWLRRHLKINLPILCIGNAMLYSVLCCVTAAAVEVKRLGVIRRHNVTEDGEVPMHAAWLLPQFFLLAGLDSFFRKSIEEFYKDNAPPHLKPKLEKDGVTQRYLGSAVDFVSGLGFMSSVLSVYVVGKVSEIGGKPNWFHYTLNRSRLDLYYWVLACLSGVNLVAFILVSVGYYYKDKLSVETARREASERSTSG